MVICLPKEMHVKIPKDDARDPGLLHLNDPECGVADVSDTHVVLKSPLDGCGTVRRTLAGKVVYTNKVMVARQNDGNEKENAPISFPFHCAYRPLRLPVEGGENEGPSEGNP